MATEVAGGSLFRPTYIKTKYKPPKMTNSTSTDVTFGGAWCNIMITKQQGYHSTTPADKQINE